MQNAQTFQLTLHFSLHLSSSLTKIPEWLSELLRPGQGGLQVKHEVLQQGARVEPEPAHVGDSITSFKEFSLFFSCYHENPLPFSIT